MKELSRTREVKKTQPNRKNLLVLWLLSVGNLIFGQLPNLTTGGRSSMVKVFRFILQPWQLLFVAMSAWVNQRQQRIIEFQGAQIEALLEKQGKRRVFLTDDQRRLLAVKGKALGRKALMVGPEKRVGVEFEFFGGADEQRTWRNLGGV